MSNERIKKFVTDPPEGPKDMAERFNKIPWYWKATGVILDAALVAGYVSEKLGYVTPTPEGTNTNFTESTPALIKTSTPEPAKVEVVQTPGEPPVVIAEGTGPILLCGDGEPVCPSNKECKIITFQAAPGVTAMSGVCVDKTTVLVIMPRFSETSVPEALPSLTSFETLNNARTFLESEEGAKWLPGIPIEEVELFPWNSAETWRMFSDLKPTGNEAYFVFLVPHTDREKFSVIGVEHIGGKIVLNYIDYDGNSRAISFKGSLDLEDLLGTDFEKLFEKNITAWPDLTYPNANSNGGLCTNRFRNPVPGMTDGFACSIDGKRGHYFQSPNIVPGNFDGGK